MNQDFDGKEQRYCGYRFECKQCGNKAVQYSIDVGDHIAEDLQNESYNTLMRQLNEVTMRVHKGHDINFLETWLNEEEPRNSVEHGIVVEDVKEEK